LSSIPLSLTVAVTAAVLSLPPAVAAAWYLERTKLPGRDALKTLILLPLVLPPVVVGYLLLRVFSPRGALGALLDRAGAPVAFHWLGAVVAAAVVGFPLFVMAVGQAMQAVDPRYEAVSKILGRSSWSTFFRVTLPLSWPGIVAGALLALARGLGEFGATIVVAGRIPGETETISLKIYAELDAPGGEARIAGLVAASVALCLVCVVASRYLERWYRSRLELER